MVKVVNLYRKPESSCGSNFQCYVGSTQPKSKYRSEEGINSLKKTSRELNSVVN